MPVGACWDEGSRFWSSWELRFEILRMFGLGLAVLVHSRIGLELLGHFGIKTRRLGPFGGTV